MRIRILIFLSDADPDPTFHPDADPDPDPRYAHISYILAWDLENDADPDPVPDPAYKFWCVSECGPGSGFLIDADPGYHNDADPCGSGSGRIHNTALQVSVS